MEEAITPYLAKFRNYLSSAKWEEAKMLGMSILQELHDFETQSTSQFKGWAPDVADTLQINLLFEWKNNCTNQLLLDDLNDFFENLA